MKSNLLLARFLAVVIVLGILALLEWAFGLGRFLGFFFVTSLIWIVPLWLRRKIYNDRQESSWLGACNLALLFAWLGAQAWYIVSAPGGLTPQQARRAEFMLLTVPSVINLAGGMVAAGAGAAAVLSGWKPRPSALKYIAVVGLWAFFFLAWVGAVSR
jgi:hypothetical protein